MKKILVIEDETPVRQNLIELLDAEGYQPIEARDGEEGVRMAWENLPDLILCDVNMPKMDGFSVLSRISKEPATATIPFIFLTARTEREDLRRGMGLGADDYIMKPFTCDDLLHAVETRLEKRSLIASQAEQKLSEMSKDVRLSLPGQMLAPLSIIFSFSELLSNREDASRFDASQICSMGQEMKRAADNLLRSIQNYLLFTELETVQASPERLRALQASHIPSARMVVSEIAQFKARQEGRADDLSLDVEDASVYISEVYLQKMIEELLDNAFRFSPSGSQVEVTGENKTEHRFYIIRVADRGRGIDPDIVAQLTKSSLISGSAAEFRAHGIGLTIVKRILDLHSGGLRIESQRGRGTLVEIRLPISE